MFGILGAPPVDWTIGLDGGRIDVAPGGPVRAVITLRPGQAIDARRVMAALVGTEEYRYSETEYTGRSSSSEEKWGKVDLFRREIQLVGPGPIAAGETRSGPVEFQIPADALPSLDARVLKMRWRIETWIDVGGRDPKFEQQLVVPLTVAQLNPDDGARMGEQVQVSGDGRPVAFWAQPAPLRAGQPFTGAIDVWTPLALESTHVELKLNTSTRMDSGGGLAAEHVLGIIGLPTSAAMGLNGADVLWRGALTYGGPSGAGHRYLFSGGVPLAPICTAVYPHGIATAALDVVINRRLRTDEHILRPVAIVTG